jgi:hypothetical protein
MRTRHAVSLLLALALLLAGCGGDDGGGGKQPLRKNTAAGTGYDLVLAPGWRDVSKNAEGSVIRFDLLIGKKGGTFNTNVNIIREKLPPAAKLEDLRKIYRGQLNSVGAKNITGSRPAAVGGDDAFTYEYDQEGPTGEQIHGRQVAVVHGGHAHTITLSASAAKFDSANQEFSRMLRSWRWK